MKTTNLHPIILELAALMTGGPLAELWCSHCGQQVEDSDKKCEHCGTKRRRTS